MKIYNSYEHKIRYAEVSTDVGEFKVTEDGCVFFWHEGRAEWEGQHWISINWSNGDAMIEELKAAGLEALL